MYSDGLKASFRVCDVDKNWEKEGYCWQTKHDVIGYLFWADSKSKEPHSRKPPLFLLYHKFGEYNRSQFIDTLNSVILLRISLELVRSLAMEHTSAVTPQKCLHGCWLKYVRRVLAKLQTFEQHLKLVHRPKVMPRDAMMHLILLSTLLVSQLQSILSFS